MPASRGQEQSGREQEWMMAATWRTLKLVPVVMVHDYRHAVPLARALLAGGIGAIEITLRTPAAWDAATAIKAEVPEIKLGVGPGMGGSQRLTRAVGKAKAMEMCLTGRMMDAVEAERAGLVARVVPADQLVDEAMKTAKTIAAMPPLAAIANKEMVNAAFETGLAQGILFERRLFAGLCATDDKAEGMTAFVEKRPGNWTGK